MMTFQEGDYFYSKNEDEEDGYTVSRCLKIDRDNNVAHVTFFQPFEEPPKAADIDRLNIIALHMPVDLDGFGDVVVIGNEPVGGSDLEGYYSYLKFTDFDSYIKETGADVEELAKEAETLFNQAADLCETEQFEKAADLFYQAYEAFPYYYEALDNAGLCHMDTGNFEAAISCFEESIEVNGNTFLTDLSLGQCCQYLDDMKAAKEWYKSAGEIPDLTAEEKELLESVIAEMPKG